MNFTVNRPKLSTFILKELQNYLTINNFKPGDKLPGERELSANLNVSRNSLREAFRVLEILGIIDIIPGSGTFIREINDETILPLAFTLSIENNSFNEIIEVRTTLESQNAYLAALRRDENDLQEMTIALENMKNSLENNMINWLESDMYFHKIISRAANNSLLYRLYQTINVGIHKQMSESFYSLINSEEHGRKLLNEHTQIFEFIKAQDAESAKNETFKHISSYYLDY